MDTELVGVSASLSSSSHGSVRVRIDIATADTAQKIPPVK